MSDFSYYIYKVGSKNYKPETKKLVWNVFKYDFNEQEIKPINLFEYNWVFLKEGLLVAKKKYSKDFSKFSSHIKDWLQFEFWSRCQYETIISGWPPKSFKQEDLTALQNELNEEKQKYKDFPHLARVYPSIGPSYKIDVYTQVMMNWDRFIEYVWNNKHLITKKKLGLEACTK